MIIIIVLSCLIISVSCTAITWYMANATKRFLSETVKLLQRPEPELTCTYCERPLSECDADRCVMDATDENGNVLS